MDNLYADIIVDIALQKLDRQFSYIVPDELKCDIRIGSLVSVPFGGGNRYVKGYVLSLSDKTDVDPSKLKAIDALLTDESTISTNLLSLAIKMKELYGGTLSQSLKVVMPAKKKIKVKKREVLLLTASLDEAEKWLETFEKKHQRARYRLLNELILQQRIPKEIINAKLNVSAPVIKALCELHLCELVEDEKNNSIDAGVDSDDVILNEEQQKIVSAVVDDYKNGVNSISLIHGITGSGKTEVYIEIADAVVRNGQQAIVLIPEIALSYQTMMRFYKRFGNKVRTIHSRLSEGERYEILQLARAGEIDVVVGPRSALFTPFSSLGVIIIDEEHEGSYNSEKTPKYHAKEMAIQRAKLEGIPLVLGSATPSIDSYYNAKNGIYKLYRLTKRATGNVLPKVEIVDLKNELRNGNRTMFSKKLISSIRERLFNNEQVLLFINRRGYASFVSCRSCGYVYKCPHCDVSLSLHKKGELLCHYCGYKQSFIKKCPDCGSPFIGTMKSGTEAVEQSLSSVFSDAKILRMDSDTTKEKDSYEKILQAFSNHEADILIGTQMIVKGHDFPDVTLVGILLADMSLYSGDFKSQERTFQLLTQCAGRAGRREKPGEVIIQTYSPEDETIRYAALQDYESFYDSEILYRKMMSYPPAGHMMMILLEYGNEKELDAFCERIYNVTNNSLHRFSKEERVSIIGPSKAAISYINDIHRRVLYIKASKYDTLVKIKDALELYVLKLSEGGLKTPSVQFDFD